VIKFLAVYILKRGFLDYYPGLAYSILIAFYEFMIVMKTRELKELARCHQTAQQTSNCIVDPTSATSERSSGPIGGRGVRH
jgi:hypothetical protein